MMAASYDCSGNLSNAQEDRVSDRFLCSDAECWIAPATVADARRQRRPELAAGLPPTLIYTPLDFGEPGTNWVGEALGLPARPLGDVAIKASAALVDLPGGPLTTIVGPIGAPSTVATLEVAIALGVRTILFFGICGSLQPELRIGDLVLVEEALREEGTSYHYLPPEEPAVAAPGPLAAAARLLEAGGQPHRRGLIWTTDAPYRETRTKVSRLAAAGVLGVEMETSAVYALAQFRGVEALSLQVVSDQLVGERWTGITRATFRDRCDETLRTLAQLASELAGRPAGQQEPVEHVGEAVARGD
jgi:uridine phosphorylase